MKELIAKQLSKLSKIAKHFKVNNMKIIDDHAHFYVDPGTLVIISKLDIELPEFGIVDLPSINNLLNMADAEASFTIKDDLAVELNIYVPDVLKQSVRLTNPEFLRIPKTVKFEERYILNFTPDIIKTLKTVSMNNSVFTVYKDRVTQKDVASNCVEIFTHHIDIDAGEEKLTIIDSTDFINSIKWQPEYCALSDKGMLKFEKDGTAVYLLPRVS